MFQSIGPKGPKPLTDEEEEKAKKKAARAAARRKALY